MRRSQWTVRGATMLGLVLALGLAHVPGAAAQDEASDETDAALAPAEEVPPADAEASEAEESADEELGAAGEPGSERERWQARAAKARARVEKARARLAAAQGAYSNMRQRNFPRGDAGAAIEKEVVDATTALREAEEALVALDAEARAADVPPAWIDPD